MNTMKREVLDIIETLHPGLYRLIHDFVDYMGLRASELPRDCWVALHHISSTLLSEMPEEPPATDYQFRLFKGETFVNLFIVDTSIEGFSTSRFLRMSLDDLMESEFVATSIFLEKESEFGNFTAYAVNRCLSFIWVVLEGRAGTYRPNERGFRLHPTPEMKLSDYLAVYAKED